MNYMGFYNSYGTLNPAESDPPIPIVEPLTLAEVKSHLRVDFADDDVLIGLLISAARAQAEMLQRRVLVRRQFNLTMDVWTDWRIPLASPTYGVNLVQYTDSNGVVYQLQPVTDYVVDTCSMPGTISPASNTTWPWFTPGPASSILVRFTAGYAPDDPYWSHGGALVKAGMLLLISHWYTNRLPAVIGTATELPFAITTCLNNGSLRRPR